MIHEVQWSFQVTYTAVPDQQFYEAVQNSGKITCYKKN